MSSRTSTILSLYSRPLNQRDEENARTLGISPNETMTKPTLLARETNAQFNGNKHPYSGKKRKIKATKADQSFSFTHTDQTNIILALEAHKRTKEHPPSVPQPAPTGHTLNPLPQTKNKKRKYKNPFQHSSRARKRQRVREEKSDLHQILPPLADHILSSPIKWTHQGIRHIITKHLHTSQTLDSPFVNVPLPYLTPWNAKSPLDHTLGASPSTPSTFLHNANTWINLTLNDPSQMSNYIDMAIKATRESTHPTRICILTQPFPHGFTVPQQASRLHVLITINPYSVTLQQTAPGTRSHINQTGLWVLLIESKNAQPFDITHLRRDLHTIDHHSINTHAPPWQ